MGLYLRSRDLDAISATGDALSAPHAFGNVRQWIDHAAELLRDLVGGEGSLVYGPGFGFPGVASLNLDPNIARDFASYLTSSDSGELRSTDEVWNAGLERRRQTHVDVWTMEDVRAAMPRGVRFEDTPIYQEVTEPSKMLFACGIGTISDSGEAHFGIVNSRDRWRFGTDTRAVVSLLHPSFKAGCLVYSRTLEAARNVGALISLRQRGTAVFDRAARELVDVSPHFASMCANSAAQHCVSHAAREVARALDGRRRGARGLSRPLTVMRRVKVRDSVVDVVATWLADPGLVDGGAILVHATDGGQYRLPSRAAIVARGLTPREADVALLLAQGRARNAIASLLGLSSHTVRHHTESVFRKLGVHTRSAVALALLQDG